MKILGKIAKWLGLSLAFLLVFAALVVIGARLDTWLSVRLTGKNAVGEGVYVDLGGQEQYLLIRGADASNPVIIWLHGGPSSPDGYVNHAWQKHLTDRYTFINWDQRGCGRTYFRNAAADPDNKTATFDQALLDLDALVDYARERFGQEQVILVGHSYGTMLGSRYALDHPDKVAAYVGVGQLVSFESDLYSYEHALVIAKERGDDTSAMENAHAVYLAEPTLPNMIAMRRTTTPYHTAEREANTLWLGASSPFMGLDDMRWFLVQCSDMEEYFARNQALFDAMFTADVRDFGLTYAMPVGFITGGSDWTTPAKYAQDYHDMITAPDKRIALLDGCGHAPHYDAPEEFCTLLTGMLDAFLPR